MQFSPQSKVWIYQSNREFTSSEVALIQNKLEAFVAGWLAHGHELKAKAEVLYNFFIVLIVDEGQAPATGCSIDGSVRMIKQLEQELGLDLFNRYNMAYRSGDKIVVVDKEAFETLIDIKEVAPETIVFNNMVQTLQDFETKWEVPFSQSWHKHVFGHLIS